MAEKGGKGYVPPKFGKDDSSTKSKKGKSVQFDVGDDGGKSGKGDKVANGTKKAAGKAPSPQERRLEHEIPQNSTCLMDCEAAEVLISIQDQMVFLSQDPDIKLPGSFDTGLTYAKRGVNFAKPQTIKKILEPLKKHGVSDCEICLIANLCPESADEVFALIPGLKPTMNKVREPLNIALGELANLKQALANLKDSI